MELAVAEPESRVITEHQQTNPVQADMDRSNLEESAVNAAQQGLSVEPAEDRDSLPGPQQAVKPLLEEAVIEDENLTAAFVADKPLEAASLIPAEPVRPPAAADLVGLQTAGGLAAKPEYYVDAEISADTETPGSSVEEPEEQEPAQASAETSKEAPTQRETLVPADVQITQRADTAKAVFQLTALNSLAPEAKRFQLARTVSNKEPQGELRDIRFKADGSAVVWAYSEVIGMRGSQLKYIWLHQGAEVARVPVGVRGDRWRSYSSKNINQAMSGAWRVELQDDRGRLLASADFQL